MKRFKEYLIEEMATDTVSQDTTPTAHNPQIDPPAPSMFAPDSVKQNYNKFVTQRAEAPQINQGEQPEVQAPEEGWEDPFISPETINPSPDQWNMDNPMPRQEDFDRNGDGILDDEENSLYKRALDRWQGHYEAYLIRREWYQSRPHPDDYRTWDEYIKAMMEWMQRRYPDYEEGQSFEEREYLRGIFQKILRGYGIDNPNHPYFIALFNWYIEYQEWINTGRIGEPPTPPNPSGG
jgi:hypothetical protein